MEARTMRNYKPGLELLSTPVLPLTVTNPTVTTPTAISLGTSIQGGSQFLISFPPGVEPQGILCSWTVTRSPESSLNILPGGAEVQQSFMENVYTYNCNQLPASGNDPFPGYDTIINSNGIYDSVFNDVFPVVPAPSSHYPPMVNYPMPEYLPDANQNSIGEIVSGIINQRDASAHFNSQNSHPIPNAAAAASQQSQVMSWMSPIVPHNYVPAPSPPEYAIRFEPAIFAPPPLFDSQRTNLSAYESCMATSSRYT
ncbi:hypothetical protein BDZ91DRAFT_712447 [Kalaharituber pfeilii]|nr:hypothetical protein BDZ91DRAFT_712447 [Kalaharituber pfeilii]